MILNMFRPSLCSSSRGQLYIYSIWYRHTLYAAIQCTDQKRDTEDVDEVTCIPLSISSLWVVFIKVFFIFTVKV
jgi:hypothetical protein